MKLSPRHHVLLLLLASSAFACVDGEPEGDQQLRIESIQSVDGIQYYDVEADGEVWGVGVTQDDDQLQMTMLPDEPAQPGVHVLESDGDLRIVELSPEGYAETAELDDPQQLTPGAQLIVDAVLDGELEPGLTMRRAAPTVPQVPGGGGFNPPLYVCMDACFEAAANREAQCNALGGWSGWVCQAINQHDLESCVNHCYLGHPGPVNDPLEPT